MAFMMASSAPSCFNAARGFVGGAARLVAGAPQLGRCFNAARGFVGGAAANTWQT